MEWARWCSSWVASLTRAVGNSTPTPLDGQSRNLPGRNAASAGPGGGPASPRCGQPALNLKRRRRAHTPLFSPSTQAVLTPRTPVLSGKRVKTYCENLRLLLDGEANTLS